MSVVAKRLSRHGPKIGGHGMEVAPCFGHVYFGLTVVHVTYC